MSERTRTIDDISVRPLSRELLIRHLDEVLALEAWARRTVGEAYSHEEWTEEHFLAERPDKWELSAGAFHDGRLVGFLIASRDGADLHIHRLAVDPDARGAAAQPLLARVDRTARAHELRRITLSVGLQNDRAVRFFRGLRYSTLSGEPLRAYAEGHGLEFADDHVRAEGREYLILAKTPDL